MEGVTFERIEEQGLEEWLGRLREGLHEKRYRPDPVRRVMIPKMGGGERPLGIPTIQDRVVQASAKVVLEPVFEADFEDCAYGSCCSFFDTILHVPTSAIHILIQLLGLDLGAKQIRNDEPGIRGDISS